MHRKLLSFLLVCLLLITAGCGSNNSNPANYQDQTNNAPSQPEEPEAPTQPKNLSFRMNRNRTPGRRRSTLCSHP